MRLIDADKLDWWYKGRNIRHVIDDAPTVDAVPVVHGRWSDAGFGELPKHAPYGWACSACGGISFNNEYIYCPNCGAKMDGGDNTER
jgi:hypothetical protein